MAIKSIPTLLLLMILIPIYGRELPPDRTLWFTYPATDWKTQALHVGNGYMGASFYGGIARERFDIAEKSFWAGGPNVSDDYNYGVKRGGNKYIGLIRQKVVEGDYVASDSLSFKYLMGDWKDYGYFSNVGSLIIDFKHERGTPSDYIRGLDVANSEGFVSYTLNGVKFDRTYFASYPDKVFAFQFSADKSGMISFTLSQSITKRIDSVEFEGEGQMVVHGFIEENGLKYCIRITVIADGGTISHSWDRIRVDGADSAVILYTVDTEYKMEPPLYKGVNPDVETRKVMNAAVSKGYDCLKISHSIDYKTIYDRVKLKLAGDTKLEKLPTNERVIQRQKGMVDDAALDVLWFNLGRYMIISSSREGTLPSTLTGAWNTFEVAPWQGCFQINIGTQEMYWACEPANIPESHESFLQWIEALVVPGRVAAKEYYGTEGWVSHVTSNPWGHVAPGYGVEWGLYPSSAAWLCRHLWDHYDYSRDKNYLRQRAYPVMKEAAQFWLANLTMRNGYYIIAPSASAEHGIEIDSISGIPVKYTTVNGETDSYKWNTVPAFQDIQIVKDLFQNVITASQTLGVDQKFRREVETALKKMQPQLVGRYGQLQEWILDVDNPRDHHRHISHLYSLYPASDISPLTTPDLAKAARISLNMRGEGYMRDRWYHAGGSWSMAYRFGCWARLFDGDRAMKVFNMMIRDTGFENMMTSQSNNLMVDGMMGSTAVMTELLMQSHSGYINLLPALPPQWSEGSVEGLVARGGYTVSIKWEYGQLVSAIITVPKGMKSPKLLVGGNSVAGSNKRITIAYL